MLARGWQSRNQPLDSECRAGWFGARLRPSQVDPGLLEQFRHPVAPTAPIIAGLAVAIEVRAGGDKIAFPENYAKGVI